MAADNLRYAQHLMVAERFLAIPDICENSTRFRAECFATNSTPPTHSTIPGIFSS